MRRKINLFKSTVIVDLALTMTAALSGVSAEELSTERVSVHAYALLVGSNRPGDNQEPLRFAHHDTARMKRVLSELGNKARALIPEAGTPMSTGGPR